MNNFKYYNPTEIIFGKETVKELGNKIKGKYNKVLLHYGGGTIKKIGLYDQVLEELKKAGVQVVELGGVEPNPKLELVNRGIELCREENIDFILAVGGGSVIDSAKAIAAGVKYDGDIWDFFEGKEIGEIVPLGVILTLPATGSETSPSTVVTKEEGLLKKGADHDGLRPTFAIMDPNWTLSLSEDQTFSGIVDIISHVLERYWTKTENVELTDELCEGTLRTVINNAYKLRSDLKDYDARAEIMISGTIAHSGILGLGREEDWASHRIGHEITALYGTTHGVTLSIILPAWMKYVYKEDLSRWTRFANNVFYIQTQGRTKEEVALKGINKFEEFLEDMGMPTRLSDANIPLDDFEKMAEKCTKGGPVGNFKSICKSDVIEILKLAK